RTAWHEAPLVNNLTDVNVTDQPIWLAPGVDSQAFDEGASVAFPAIGASAPVLEFQVEQGYNGIIKRIGNQFFGGGFNEGTGGLYWQILADDVPIANYEDVLVT